MLAQVESLSMSKQQYVIHTITWQHLSHKVCNDRSSDL